MLNKLLKTKALSSLIFGIIFLIIAVIYIIFIRSNNDFKSQTWLEVHSTSSKVGGLSERQKMKKDLVENVLPNKTKNEIEELLGNSLNSLNFSKSKPDMLYKLGRETDSYPNIKMEWLLIWLDQNKKYKKYEIKKK